MYKLGTMLIFWGIALEVLVSFAVFMYIVICTVAGIPAAQHNECLIAWLIASVVCTVMVCTGANLVKSNETD